MSSENQDTESADKVTDVEVEKQPDETKHNSGFHSEFHYGSFRRTLTVPPGTETDDVEANYSEGILEVRVPVDQPQKPASRYLSVTDSGSSVAWRGGSIPAP